MYRYLVVDNRWLCIVILFLRRSWNKYCFVYDRRNHLTYFLQVQVFYVNEYPESGMGSIVTAKKGTKLSIMVKPFVTISTDRIKHLPVAERFCYFPDEQHLSVSRSYTQKSCLIECRLNYLHRKCDCRPYYFNMLGK